MRRQAQAQSAFAHRGVTCDIVLTERPGHAAEVADERGRDYDAVFTLGGDGTVMEVIGTLAHSDVPIGVLPGGTGNLIARVLGIPLRVGKAVDVLLDGDEARIDLGSIGGHRFAFAAGVGVDAKMVETTAASAPAAKARRTAIGPWAAQVTIQPGRSRFSGPASCASRSGRWTPSALMRRASLASAPTSSRAPHARVIARKAQPTSSASAAPKAR